MRTKAQAQVQALRDVILWVIATLKTTTSRGILMELDEEDCFVDVHEMYECIDQLCHDGLLRMKGGSKLTDKIMLGLLEASMSNDPRQHAKLAKMKSPTYSLTPRGWRALHVGMLTYLMRPKNPIDRPWLECLVQAIVDGTEDLVADPAEKKTKSASTKKKPKTSTRSR